MLRDQSQPHSSKNCTDLPPNKIAMLSTENLGDGLILPHGCKPRETVAIKSTEFFVHY